MVRKRRPARTNTQQYDRKDVAFRGHTGVVACRGLRLAQLVLAAQDKLDPVGWASAVREAQGLVDLIDACDGIEDVVEIWEKYGAQQLLTEPRVSDLNHGRGPAGRY